MEEVLPPEIQEFSQLLKGNDESGSQSTEFVTSITLSKFGREEGFWKVSVVETGDKWRIFDIPWAQTIKQSRLRVLEAIGSCKTLRSFFLLGTLRSEELEALLTPLQSSLVLECISLWDLDSSPVESEEAIDLEWISAAERVWTILGNILRTSCTLRALHLEFTRLSDVVVQNLASALRGNSNSTLYKLSLSGWEGPSVAKHVAEIVLAAPKLAQLKLREIGVLGDDDVKALSNAVVQKKLLKSLGLGQVRRGGAALLLESLAGEDCNKSIVSLRVNGFIDGLGDCLPIILSSNRTLRSVEVRNFHGAQMSRTESRKLGQSLRSNASLTQFCIHFLWSYISIEGIDSLREILSAINIKKPVIKLQISTSFRGDPEDSSGSSSVSDVVISNVASIRWLWLFLEDAGRERVSLVENICEALQSNSTVEELYIRQARGRHWSPCWKKMFLSLRYNTTITLLDLIECDGLGEDEFKDLMGILQVNMTLKRIVLVGTSWEKDGKAALIKEALSRNAKQQSYFSILGHSTAKLEFEAAKAARLFICGAPRAGKTRLRQTLTRLVRGTNWLGDKLAELRRTKGIEVEMLRDDHDMQIAMWDLGGQSIFRTLQDILFPRTNQTFMFLFVFSVYDEVRDRMKDHLDESFKTDLEEWLRFIASNVQITGTTLPKVLVAISHMDKLKYRFAGWAEIIVQELRVEFQDVLDLCSSETLYQMDARKKKEVAPLKDFIFHTFRELLETKVPIVPKVCSRLNSALTKRRKYFKHRPVWRSPDFYQFCFNSLTEDAIPFPTLENNLKVFEAMGSYLHDTGSIICIPNSDWIVVDPNWLTNVFLGELISLGQNFHENPDARSIPGVAPFHSRSGFVSYSVFHQLVSCFVSKHSEIKELNENLVEELLIHLDLCYKVDGGNVSARYYIPTIVCEDAASSGDPHSSRGKSIRPERLSWKSPVENNQDFVGFRVQCKNPRRMRITSAFFPRFQIHTRDKLMKEMDLTDDDVICSRNYLHLFIDGHEVFVERRDMAKSHIDVMVKCSKRKSREIVVRYVQKHIIEELHKFCASPKGCPGIALVVGILRVGCVEKLVPWESRGDNQSTLEENLTRKLEGAILECMEDIRGQSWSTNSLLNCEHSWPAIPGYLEMEFELVTKLLSNTAVESATSKLLESHQQRFTTLDHTLQEISQELESAECAPKVVSELGSTSVSFVIEESSSLLEMSGKTNTRQSTTERVMMARMDSLKKRIDHLGHRIEERFDEMASTLRRIETNLDSIIVLQHQFQSVLTSFNSKVDRMIGYAESLERARTPKRPYLSFDNMSIFQKVMGMFCAGTPVRLHLLCESSAGPHIVKDQLGLQFCLAKENMEWLRCIYDISFKMLLYLAKAGLHVTLGLGNVVPGLESVEAALPLLIAATAVDTIQIDKNMLLVDRSGDMPLNEAWSRLQNVLAPQLENHYTSLFNLYKVKYLNLKEGGYAWLCEQCMVKGARNRSLECL